MNRLNWIRLLTFVAVAAIGLALVMLIAPTPKSRPPLLSAAVHGDRLIVTLARSKPSSTGARLAGTEIRAVTCDVDGLNDHGNDDDDTEPTWSETSEVVGSTAVVLAWPRSWLPEPTDADAEHAADGETGPGDLLIWTGATCTLYAGEALADAAPKALPPPARVVRLDGNALFTADFARRYPRAALAHVAILPESNGGDDAEATTDGEDTEDREDGAAHDEEPVSGDAHDTNGDDGGSADDVDDDDVANASTGAPRLPPLLLTYVVGDALAFIERAPNGELFEYLPPLPIIPVAPPVDRPALPRDRYRYPTKEPVAEPAVEEDADGGDGNIGNGEDGPALSSLISPTARRVHTVRTLPDAAGGADVLYTTGERRILYWARCRRASALPDHHRELPADIVVFDAVRTPVGIDAVAVARPPDTRTAQWIAASIAPGSVPEASMFAPPTLEGRPPPATTSALALTTDRLAVYCAYLAQGKIRVTRRELPAAIDGGAATSVPLEFGPPTVVDFGESLLAPSSELYMFMMMSLLMVVAMLVMFVTRMRRRAQLAAAAPRAEGPHTPPPPSPPQPDKRSDTTVEEPAPPQPTEGEASPDTDAAGRTASPEGQPAESTLPNAEAPEPPKPREAKVEEDADDPLAAIEKRLGFVPAGVLLRGLAAMVDFMIIIPLVYAIGEPLGLRVGDDFLGGPDAVGIHVLNAIVHFFYFSLMEYYFERSLGKMLLRIRVQSVARKRPAFWQIAVRNLLRIPDYYVLFILMFFNERGQRLGDMLGRTVVSRDKPPAEDIDIGG